MSERVRTLPEAGTPALAGDDRRPATRSPSASGKKQRRLMEIAGFGLVVGAVAAGVPWVEAMLTTVSTDDAYVNGHVTFVAPRVAGQIANIFVDNNNRVHKGEILAQLDREPYQVVVDEKRAAVDTARANLEAATASVRAIEAEARSRRWNLQLAIQDVDSQVALLQARVAAIEKSKAALGLAQVQFSRARQLVPQGDTPREVYDQRQAELTAAGAELVQSLSEVHQLRTALGLPAQPPGRGDLGQVPPDLDNTFSSVRRAQAELIQSAAQLGIVHSFAQTPKDMLEQFEKLGSIDSAFEQFTAQAPAVKQTMAQLEVAERDLAQAELNLRYCDITADIDGVINRRNINPGDFVQVGQNLMAIQSLREVWVDANFKETQLRDLRIGQPVDLYVDMYGGRHTFRGRISGFTEGTGSTLALLPAENATGNFIKVVQRLPVWIDLVDYDPDRTPLFVGTSVVPSVHINLPPTGPNAGKFLQSSEAESASPAVSDAAAASGSAPGVAR